MRKKILILSHSDGLPFLESCNQYTQLFDTNLYEVTVAYLVNAYCENTVKLTLAEKILFLNLPRSAIRGLKISAIAKLFKLCRQEKYQLVICHRYKPTYIMLMVAMLCKIPKLLFVMHANGTMQSFARRLQIYLLFKNNMYFGGVSNVVKEDLKNSLSRLPANHFITLHNILDEEKYTAALLPAVAARQALNIDENTFLFGHIGRLVKDKDQRTLIQAFATIASEVKNAKLIIIGDGQLRATLEKQVAEANLSARILFIGFWADAHQLMRAFDGFILCSIREGFGRVLLEAMVAHIPIIATRISGIPEVVGDGGTLVEAGNAEALAKAMLTLYHTNKVDRQRLGDKAYQRLINHFTLPIFREKFWQNPIFKDMK